MDRIYTIYDQAASQAAVPPFVAKNGLVAQRLFKTFIDGQPEHARDDFYLKLLPFTWSTDAGSIEIMDEAMYEQQLDIMEDDF